MNGSAEPPTRELGEYSRSRSDIRGHRKRRAGPVIRRDFGPAAVWSRVPVSADGSVGTVASVSVNRLPHTRSLRAAAVLALLALTAAACADDTNDAAPTTAPPTTAGASPATTASTGTAATGT